ncbi:MAG: LytTR family DNA-binding domain-containing protein [Verrucomicrobiota bacterium]
MKIRTLIVDDEPLARERLRKLLEAETDIEVIGESADGKAALEEANQARPDLIFLDVQMPELDGFGVIAGLAADPLPAIIFVTAYDQFALRAFEVHALDYLLKPFDRERFQKSLERARTLVQQRQTGDLSQKLSSLITDLKPEKTEPKYLDRLAIKMEGRVLFFKTDDIDWIEAADNYVSVHVGGEEHLHRETMASLETKLPPNRFLRISRSTIVNVERIKEMQPMFHGDYVVILKDGTRLGLSRNYRDKLNQLLGK